MIINILKVLFLPLFLLRDVVKSQRSKLRKFGYVILIIVIFGSIWMNAINSTKTLLNLSLFELGVTDKITKIKISGTSMMPTLKDGGEVELRSPKKFGIERGDIVTFQNVETGNLSYIKRVIGLENEKVSIKNGHYYIDGKALEENYTLNKLPTFGNTFLGDCEVVTVPKDHYFVSGDNRTVSSDSRVLGFINKEDIDGVIKTGVAGKFATQVSQKTLNNSLDSQRFLTTLNSARNKEKLPNFVTHSLLNQIAKDRASQISSNYENWKKDSVPLDKLLDSKGYRFNSVHEFVTFGYLNEADVMKQILELKSEKELFLSNNFTEVGIGVTERTYKDCTYPVISVILSWPAVPTYSQADIDSWAEEIKITTLVMSNMQTWIGAPGIDTAKIRQLINLASEENQIATRLHTKMTKKEWLTQKDYQDVKRYDQSVKEFESIYSDVFGEVQGVSTSRIPKKNLKNNN